MKQKMINVLNWLKSRKTAFLTCLLVVCVGCSVLAVSRSNKTAKAEVIKRDETAFSIQTFLPPVLSYPLNSQSSDLLQMACPLTFYVRSEGFAFTSGAEYRLFNSDKFGTYLDYSTYFYARYNSGYNLVISPIRGFVNMFTNSLSWQDFYFRCMKNEYSLTLQYINKVIKNTSVSSSANYNGNNSAFYRFNFVHNDNSKYNFTFAFYLSSMNSVPSTATDFKLTNQKGLTDDYQIAYYYTVFTSIVNVVTDNQYQQGYQDGKTAGLTEGEQKGYQDGKTAGLTEGEKIGYDKGLNEKLQNITPWQTIVDGVNSFLNVQVLPGVKVSVILSVGFGLVLLGLAIKIFLGG